MREAATASGEGPDSYVKAGRCRGALDATPRGACTWQRVAGAALQGSPLAASREGSSYKTLKAARRACTLLRGACGGVTDYGGAAVAPGGGRRFHTHAGRVPMSQEGSAVHLLLCPPLGQPTAP